jgi:predicted membrane protein
MSDTFEQSTHSDDYIDATAIFGEVRKYILSKDFKFGSITNVFGRVTIDFTTADINGMAVVDISQFFGEVRIKVPAGWHVVNEISHIFAGVDDKRKNTININPNKVLVLKGIGVFAAVKVIGDF